MQNKTRKQLEESLAFEQAQLTILEQQVAAKPPVAPVQVTNWPKLLESHRRAIAFYKARLADLDRAEGKTREE
jgi:hypothetical protein